MSYIPRHANCHFCPRTCTECKGRGRCECHELVDGHGELPPEPDPMAARAEAAALSEHGGSGYRYVKGCRCAECREANRLRCKRRTDERTMELWIDPTLAPHGRASTYENWGCRCESCTEAHSAKCREYRARRADG